VMHAFGYLPAVKVDRLHHSSTHHNLGQATLLRGLNGPLQVLKELQSFDSDSRHCFEKVALESHLPWPQTCAPLCRVRPVAPWRHHVLQPSGNVLVRLLGLNCVSTLL
jgi:hypothetical protein